MSAHRPFEKPPLRPPHPATIVQRQSKPFGYAEKRPPHPAMVQPKAARPHAATLPAARTLAARAGESVQRASFFHFLKGAITSENYLERAAYTSCYCYVASDVPESEIGTGFLDKSTLSGMQTTWGSTRPFHYFSIGRMQDELFGIGRGVFVASVNGGWGAWPLIVLVGHCSAGSESLTSHPNKSVHFPLNAVADAVFELLKVMLPTTATAGHTVPLQSDPCVTIFHSMCSSGVQGQGGEPSFQTRLDTRLLGLCMHNDILPNFVSIGTLSTSSAFGLGFWGKVLASDFICARPHLANEGQREVLTASEEQTDYQQRRLALGL